MKKLLVICLALVIFASVGCGNKPDSARESSETDTETARLVHICDPVDGSELNPGIDSKYMYVYKDTEYHFNSKDNYEAFKKDPEKYVSQ